MCSQPIIPACAVVITGRGCWPRASNLRQAGRANALSSRDGVRCAALASLSPCVDDWRPHTPISGLELELWGSCCREPLEKKAMLDSVYETMCSVVARGAAHKRGRSRRTELAVRDRFVSSRRKRELASLSRYPNTLQIALSKRKRNHSRTT